MGVKPTVKLSRKEAELKYIKLYVDRKTVKLQAKARDKVASLTGREIEDKLEQWNYEANGSEGFYNYSITDSYLYEG